ncbi:MAG: efflux RND transporter periplasmic adaptor subunit, partial [Planctomycetia bacterium]
PTSRVLLSEQAQKNLKLTSMPLKVQTYWKTLSIPGMVVDRPGFSDRGVVAPVTGVVAAIHRTVGETVTPGESLFTIRLSGESLHQTQTDLFKATQDVKLAVVQKERLVAAGGGVPEARIIEVAGQILRHEVAVKAYRRELLNRGLAAEQVDGVAEGRYVNEIDIAVPKRSTGSTLNNPMTSPAASSAPRPTVFELQELKVELGWQVQAGQTMCLLSNHQSLAVEGRAFRDETPLLERAVTEGWPVEVDFGEEASPNWPPLEQTFRIATIANNIDPETRTFRFLMPLENQSRTIERDGWSQLLWRFRPGQQVRLSARVEPLENVFVLPVDAVVREAGEAYVFRQNVNVFDRKPVQIVYQDRRHVVLANDGGVPPGVYVARTGAAQLNRMAKSQSGASPKGFHIHADGSLHMGAH